MEIITYSQARDAGRLRYFTGKPCHAGHIAERYTNRGTCLACHALRASRYIEENAAKRKETSRAYYSNNKPEITKKLAKYREDNRTVCNARAADWAKRNKSRVTSYYAARRVLQKTATPVWANTEAIRNEYALAAWCSRVMGEPYQVDHVIPINHPLVCGLHVPLNLQVIPKRDNLRKSNRFEIG